MQELLQYLFSGITSGAIYAVIAIGFAMLYNATDLINFAHGEFVMLGGLGLVTLWGHLHLPLALAFPLVLAGVMLVGVLFERLAIRSAPKANPIVLVIITVGASIFFKGLAMLIWGKEAFSLPPFSQAGPITLGGARLLVQSLWILGIVVVLIVALHLFFHRTLTGKAMQACAISRKGAMIAGIPTHLMVLLAFALSTGSGAVAGMIISPVTLSSYDMGTMLGIKGFCAAMLGGLGSLWGALLGGLLLGILESLSVGYISSGVKDAVAFLLLLLVLYVRPQGLIAATSVKRF